MQPRQELLDIWRAVARISWQKGQWEWGGRDQSNSISDAEQLLCLLMPESQVPVFGLDDPDRTGDEMLRALAPLGGPTEIPRRLAGVLTEYFTKYTDADTGTPIFAGGSYFGALQEGREPTEAQRSVDIVDSFAVSVTLSLATIGFVKVYRRSTRREELLKQLDELTTMASTRLTAAMVGLLRSFSVNVFDADESFGQNLCQMVNQNNLPRKDIVAGLQRELRQTIASFREVLIGSGQVSDLDSPNQLFECGWSWGIVEDAPQIATERTEQIGEQRDGFAEQAPYLYFTVIALDAIEDLFAERTRILGLLNEEQQRLSRALQLRSDLTRSYWATVATFGDGRVWPLEDIPWRTTDGEESDYYTLQVTSLAVKGLTRQRGADAELMRIGLVLNELANRARITRRPVRGDSALGLHSPGFQLRLLYGKESRAAHHEDPTLVWTVNDFAPLLMQRMANLASLFGDAQERRTMLGMADGVWDHLLNRRLTENAGRNLWDYPTGAFADLSTRPDDLPSWYYTQRVVQALVVTANVLDQPPLRSERLTDFAVELLSEAEHLFDRALIHGAASGMSLAGTVKTIQANLRRAREVLDDRPGTAVVLASNVLNLLSEIAAAEQKANEVI
jgi:hypothetical protein